LKEDSHSEDADSDSDNGLSHNLRRRVVAEPLLLREHKSQRRPIAFNDNDVNCVHDFLGLNADGSVTGSWNRTGDRGNSGFADTDLCSPQCFWKVRSICPLPCSVLLTCGCRRRIAVLVSQSGLRMSWSSCKICFLRTLAAAVDLV